MTDTQLFPPTEDEQLATVRTHLAAEVEKREKAAVTADLKWDEARQLLATFDETMRSRAGDPVAAAVEDMRRHAVQAGIGVTMQVNHEEPVVIADVPAEFNPTDRSDVDLIGCYRRLLDETTNREICTPLRLAAFDAHCEELERRGMSLEPASLERRLREAREEAPA